MAMSNKHRSSSFVSDQDDPQSSSENGPDSPLSDDDSRAITTTAPSPKKSRRSIQRRVVSVKIEGDGSRSRGEAYPPSDSWAWRKYGQKPIKGSPYPRGYYRCSSSKGCPARKQVERNRVDPTMLIITYASEHNHPLPTSKHHHHHHQTTPSTADVTTPTTPSTAMMITSSNGSTDCSEGSDPSLFDNQQQLEFVGDMLILENLGVEYSWISDVSFHTPSFVGSTCDYADVAATLPMKEEDESLFGDLDELPECSLVFRIERCIATTSLCGST